MNSPLKIDIKQALDHEYLKQHKLIIKTPKNKIQRTKLLQIIYGSLSSKLTIDQRVNMIIEMTDKGSRNTIYKAYRNHFEINQETVGKKMASDVNLISKSLREPFLVSIIEKGSGRVRFNFRVTGRYIKEVEFKTEPAIDVEEVMRLRDEEINRPALIEPRTRHERESIALKVLKLFATGYMSIMEACERVGVKYLDFGVWVHSDQIIRKHYLESMIVRSFLVTSRNITDAQDYIAMLFKQGHRITESNEYSKLMTDGQPGGIWIETKKNIQKHQFNFTEIATLIREIKESAIPNLLANDELEGFTREELAEFANNIQQRLEEAKKRRQENGQ